MAVTESLNSRMPEPSERPISGRRLAPKSSKATSSRRMISGAPMFGMRPAYQRFGQFPFWEHGPLMRKRPLSDQVVVVTGASAGLGRAVARLAAARGAKVVVVS